MGHFISRDGSYHEGDYLIGDVSVPERPNWTFDWDGFSWVPNPERVAKVEVDASIPVDLNAVKAMPEVLDFLKMKPEQIEKYIDKNITDLNPESLNSIKDILKLLGKVVSVIARGQITR